MRQGMVADTRVIERIVLWLAVVLVVGCAVWLNVLHSRLDILNQKLVLIAGESKSMNDWAKRSDAENASLRYLRPLATRYGKERASGKGKKEAAEKAAEGWK